MRPNYAFDAPPTHITVGGFAYPVKTDFRVWLEVSRLLRQWIPDRPERNAAVYAELEELVFGGSLADENPDEVLAGVLEFLKGYPSAPVQSSGEAPCWSFEYDLNEIIIAIRNQSGVDLSYRRTEPFHWWEFLLEFKTLCGSHYFLNLMEARSYKGDDPELIKRRRMCALPPEPTAAEKALLEEINAQFYNA